MEIEEFGVVRVWFRYYEKGGGTLYFHLSLNGVEELDAPVGVNLLERGVLESRDGQRLEIEQLAVRRVLGRQDEVSEAHRKHGLAVHPPVSYKQASTIASNVKNLFGVVKEQEGAKQGTCTHK